MHDFTDLASPFGSWSVDIELTTFERGALSPLLLGSKRTVMAFKVDASAYAVKCWYDPIPDGEILRQIRLCLHAGTCVVPIVGPSGKAFRKGSLVGYVMPRETPFDPASIMAKDERLAAIQELCDLVNRLHARGIVHGDLKCQNLVRCADGALRFIDFDCASLVGDGFVATMATAEFISQRRTLRHEVDPEPLSCAEDYHALALTIFEIYSGKDDFYPACPPSSEDGDEWSSICCDAATTGMPPDVSRIDDADVAELITSYFNRGPPRILTSRRSVTICAQHELPFRCLPGQRHTYTRLVRCHMCERHPRDTCPNLFVAPPEPNAGAGSPTCRKCLPYVAHIGLDQ
ncbi:hypothetical protein BD626DRAFT_401896 [Schizophyllum amplum]|uniref:Protein kinase domain-containing protein n=1 Tax=Schizophyllum amplum TaxID=97359 RepID=A0A550CHI2_9AGAR|nr:hypothetical protein BD626DRAFT_401896 [Auriculariopsis ampla]